MMSTTGIDYGFIALWGLHILSVIAFFTGVLFLVIFATKTFTPAKLKSSAIWLIVIGTVICLFTIGVTGRPWIGKHYRGAGMGGMQMEKMGQMMEMMTEHNEGASGDMMEEHQGMMDMMRMMNGNTPR